MTSQLRTTAPRDCHCSAQLRPPLKGLPSRATACRYVYTGPGGVSSLATDPPGTPVAPCRLEVLHLFRWSTHTHTHRWIHLRERKEEGRKEGKKERKKERERETHTHTHTHTHTIVSIECLSSDQQCSKAVRNYSSYSSWIWWPTAAKVPNKSQKRGCRRQGRLGCAGAAASLGDGCAALADLGNQAGKTKHHCQQHAMGARPLLGFWAPNKIGWACRQLPNNKATQCKGFHLRPAWERGRGHRSHQFPALQGQVQRGRSELLSAIVASALTLQHSWPPERSRWLLTRPSAVLSMRSCHWRWQYNPRAGLACRNLELNQRDLVALRDEVLCFCPTIPQQSRSALAFQRATAWKMQSYKNHRPQTIEPSWLYGFV